MVVLRLWQLDRESIHRARDCDPRLTIETNGEPINHHSYYTKHYNMLIVIMLQ